jgi:hypothetical protein
MSKGKKNESGNESHTETKAERTRTYFAPLQEAIGYV